MRVARALRRVAWPASEEAQQRLQWLCEQDAVGTASITVSNTANSNANNAANNTVNSTANSGEMQTTKAGAAKKKKKKTKTTPVAAPVVKEEKKEEAKKEEEAVDEFPDEICLDPLTEKTDVEWRVCSTKPFI